jgi:hypothetical protein
MTNKEWDKVDPLDKAIRRALPSGNEDGIHLIIEYFSGFELFNTRPYHNYETWSSGYRVKGKGITVESEDLDDAIYLWIKKYAPSTLERPQ